MKKNLSFSVIVLFFLFLQSCVEEQTTPSSQAVSTQFTFPLQALTPADLQNLQLQISVVDQHGMPVLKDHSISFDIADGNATTESVILGPGEYKLTKLTLSDTRGNIRNMIYDFTDAFDGLAFSISGKSNIAHINLINAKKANLKFKLAIYTGQGANKVLTTGTAYIMDGSTVLRTYELSAKTNNLTFDLDPAAAYTLVIVKKGYARISNTFIYNQLGHGILKYGLTPGMTMLAIPSAGLNNLFSFIVESTSGTLDVDWGDGTSSSYSFSPANNSTDFSKEYATPNPYYVTVTGDLDQVTYFYSFYGNGAMHEADFFALTGLRELRFGLTEGPPIIDLTNNTNLEKLLMPGILNMEQLLLPADHNINLISVSGANLMGPAAVDAVIANIYNNSIAKGINNGEFNLSIDWGDSETDIFIGPPSAAAFTQLAYLRDSLGWLIVPEF